MKAIALHIIHSVLLVTLAASVSLISGCDQLFPNSGTTLYIRSEGRLAPNGGCPPSGCTGYFAYPVTGKVKGQVTADYPTSIGAWDSYSGRTTNTTGSTYGLYVTEDVILNANWYHQMWLPSYCETPAGARFAYFDVDTPVYQYDNIYETNGATVQWLCDSSELPPPGGASRLAYTGSIPSSITLPEIDQADAFKTTYGQPVLYAFRGSDGIPNLYTSITASSVSDNGASATFSLPDSLPQGAYALVTANRDQDGGNSTNAYNAFIVAGSQSVAGNPYGVSVGSQSYSLIESNTCTRTKTTSSSSFTFPVVSLYANNQVSVGGTAIAVGANPTAVAAYNASPVTTTSTYGCVSAKKTYSGTTRAIVVNSGGNTVSILDIVNEALLTTITVGNRPVALAISSDSKTAYVANYADSTVSKVDLSSNTTAATVTVGGNPTSVTIASDGILWVGGAGFLTKVTASTMSVAGTETVQSKNIVALSYSNPYGQLIVQATDSTGTVYQDEMNPASFTAGGTYAALASHNISTLGSYQVGSKNIRAFTSTASSSSSLPPTLPGAPPLIIQDGWIVVAATPTGFTITDVSGHLVLVSQTTASPISAIAVDPKLNVAYLTEPDSNVLLTVPLPGTAQ